MGFEHRAEEVDDDWEIATFIVGWEDDAARSRRKAQKGQSEVVISQILIIAPHLYLELEMGAFGAIWRTVCWGPCDTDRPTIYKRSVGG